MKYIVGFMFSKDGSQVALIRKEKPFWQKGLLNGIGGKVEEGESAIEAMVREFQEETGFSGILNWHHFAEMFGQNNDGQEFRVDFFHSIGDLLKLRSMESENIEIICVDCVFVRRSDMIDNLPWLIALAIDNKTDGRPSFVTVKYETYHG